MKNRHLRYCIFSLLAFSMVCLNSCCCPCESKARLLEDFWVGPEERIQWLQHQRAASADHDSGWESYELDHSRYSRK